MALPFFRAVLNHFTRTAYLFTRHLYGIEQHLMTCAGSKVGAIQQLLPLAKSKFLNNISHSFLFSARASEMMVFAGLNPFQ